MVNETVIPAQAVEAAGQALRDAFDWGVTDFEEQAKRALEAAAPHMLYEAFEQGQKSGMRHASRIVAANKIGRPELPGPISPNPYRPTK